ncbi:MAG: hypothetical protein IPM53_18210 [Anaerolineaceae bacterium]|nr:hypothetical protein [Anaerolineaceae bacterium]
MLTQTHQNSVKIWFNLGRENHGHYTVMPRIGVITEPMEVNGWKFLPLEMDDSVIPREAWKHVELLRDNGVIIKQVIVGHNLIEEEEKRQKMEACKKTAEKVVSFVATLAVGFMTAIAGAGAMLALGFVGLLVAIDPILVVVLEDGTWLCVAEWDS